MNRIFQSSHSQYIQGQHTGPEPGQGSEGFPIIVPIWIFPITQGLGSFFCEGEKQNHSEYNSLGVLISLLRFILHSASTRTEECVHLVLCIILYSPFGLIRTLFYWKGYEKGFTNVSSLLIPSHHIISYPLTAFLVDNILYPHTSAYIYFPSLVVLLLTELRDC